MTRKDFQLVADVIAGSAMAGAGSDVGNAMRDRIARGFARELAATHPRFDVARFLKACGVPA